MMGMKVLHLIDSGGLYGAENMLLDLAEEQQRKGLRPLIVSAGTPDITGKPIEAEARRRGLAVKQFRMRAGLNFRKGMEVRRCAQREGFHILRGLLPRVSRQIPAITMLHGYAHASPFSILWFNHRPDE